MANHKHYEDDDGRTIADMSGVSSSGLLSGWTGGAGKAARKRSSSTSDNPYSDPIMDRSQRHWFILGTLKATMMIAAVYIIGVAVVFGLIGLIWSLL